MNDLVKKAFEFGRQKHEGQKDDNGKDYFTSHCVPVYAMLAIVTAKVRYTIYRRR